MIFVKRDRTCRQHDNLAAIVLAIILFGSISGCGGGTAGSTGGGGLPPPGSSLQPTDPLSTDPGGIAFDASTTTLFYASFGSDRFYAINAATNVLTGSTRSSDGLVRSAFNATTRRLYVVDLRNETLSCIDPSTMETVSVMPVGRLPRSLTIDEASNRVYVANYGDETVSVIDGASSVVTDTIHVGRLPRAIGVNSITNRVYVANYLDRQVTVVDGATKSTVAQIPVGDRPGQIWVDSSSNRVWVTNTGSDTVSLVDGASNSVIDTIHTGSQPTGVSGDTAAQRIFVGNEGDRTLTVIEASSGSSHTIALSGTPNGVYFSKATGKVYAADYAGMRIFVIDPLADTILATVSLGGAP